MFPQLGYGIGLRRQHFALLSHAADGVDWFEVISEDYFVAGGRPWHVLDHVRRTRPIVLHGVALGIGNPDPISDEYLQQLSKLIDRVEPAWVSDHLCWGALAGAYAHELLPMPYDDATLAHVVERVSRVQEQLGQPLVLENISAYTSFASNTYAECDFRNQLVQTSGCRLLLDVNNVYVSSRNLGFCAEQYIDAIDCEERCLEIYRGMRFYRLYEEHPSRTASLRGLGAAFTSFIARSAASQRWLELPDLCALDWARLTVFDDVNPKPYAEADIAQAAEAFERLPVRLLAAHGLVDTRYAIENCWRALDRRERAPVPDRRSQTLLVWKRAFEVRHRALEAWEASLLRALRTELTLGEVCASIARHAAADSGQAQAKRVFETIRQWLFDGLLVASD